MRWQGKSSRPWMQVRHASRTMRCQDKRDMLYALGAAIGKSNGVKSSNNSLHMMSAWFFLSSWLPTTKTAVDIRSMLFIPSNTTCMTWVSLQFSRLQNGGITLWDTRQATCVLFPEIVRLEMAHAASFCVWNSLLDRCCMTMGTSPCSIIACTCYWFPAVILDRNQTASLLIFSFEWLSRCGKCSRAPWFITVWVWSSVPVTMFPTALNAAVCTFTSLWDN